jgi:hypothetical protein
MLDVDTFLITLYVIVDDFCHSQSPRRRPGPEASLSESEVLTPAISARWSLLNDPDYVVGAGADTSVRLGAFLEVIIAIAIIGTAVTLFPIVKRQNEGFALGNVAARVLESTVIVVGMISLLSVVTLRQDLAGGAGADAALLGTSGKSLVAVHDWTFLLGPGVVPGVNGVLLGYSMYTSRIVARALALLGLVGGPLLFASGIAVLFGVIEADSVWQGISTLPVAAFEVLLGIWLIVKGFNPSAPLLTASAT